LQGAQGEQGIPGPVGATGSQGPVGQQGVVGPQGVPGPRGESGLTKNEVAALVIDMAKRGSIPNYSSHEPAAAGISKADLQELVRELKAQQPAPAEKKRGFFSRLLYGKE